MTTYIIYRHMNRVTKKSYIGFTKRTMGVRWKQHLKASRSKKSKFYNALRTYPPSKWDSTVLVQNVPALFKNAFERYWINFYDSYRNGYNSTLGGDGGRDTPTSQEVKEKISRANKGKKRNFSDKERNILSIKAKQNPLFSMLGRTHSEETKKKISKNNGRSCHRKGVKLTDEQKQVLSKASLGNNSRASVTQWKILSSTGIECIMDGYNKKTFAREIGVNYKAFQSRIYKGSTFTEGILKGCTVIITTKKGHK